jgi:predicted nucleic acid-binding protein
MEPRVVVDTGFLVALLNRRDRHHAWAREQLPSLQGPWVTAEACLSETLFLLESAGKKAAEALMAWIDRGLLQVRGLMETDSAAVSEVLFFYADRWVDLADASLVVLSDRHPRLPVVSVDVNDFTVYFRQRRARRLLLPPTPS